jgi:hypothetical protein
MTLASSLHDYARELGQWWQAQRERLRDLEALHAMSDREIEELSGEMGLSRGQLEALVKAGPDAAGEMDRMMAALEIDAAAVRAAYPAMIRDMQVNCATCGDKGTCRRALAEGTAPALLTTFCPNSDELLELARSRDLCSA